MTSAKGAVSVFVAFGVLFVMFSMGLLFKGMGIIAALAAAVLVNVFWPKPKRDDYYEYEDDEWDDD